MTIEAGGLSVKKHWQKTGQLHDSRTSTLRVHGGVRRSAGRCAARASRRKPTAWVAATAAMLLRKVRLSIGQLRALGVHEVSETTARASMLQAGAVVKCP